MLAEFNLKLLIQASVTYDVGRNLNFCIQNVQFILRYRYIKQIFKNSWVWVRN